MATEVVVTVRSSGGDYTSLSAAEAGEQRNLVSADEIAVFECYSDWTGDGLNESAGVTIAGWTTDSTRHVVVRAATGQGHGGIPGAGFRMWRFENTVLSVTQSYTLIDGIECRNTDDANGFNYAVTLVGTGLVVRNTIGSASYRVFFLDSDSFANPVTAIQCLALPAGPNRTPTGFFHVNSGSSYGRAINCVVGDGCSVGFNANFSSGSRKFEAINCVVYSASTTSYSSTFDAASANNAATDGSSNTPPGSSPYTSDVVSGDFVDAAGNDFHLAASSGLIGQGANQYSATATDIDGDAWPSSGAWDIGFDSYTAAGGITGTATTSLSLAVQQARSIAAGMSVAVQAPRSATTATSLAVQVARTAQASLAVAVQQARADVAAVQLAVQDAGVQSAAVDMAVQLAASAAASLDLAVQSQGSATTALSLQVQAAASVSASLNLQVQDAHSVGVAVSAAVLRQALATAGLQLAVQTTGSAGAGLSVALRVAQASAAVLSLAVQATRSAVAAVDLQVQDGATAAVGVDLAVQHAAAAAAAVQLAIANAGSANASLAAAVMVRRSVSAAIEASVRASRSASAGASLFVFDPSSLVRAAITASRLALTSGNRMARPRQLSAGTRVN